MTTILKAESLCEIGAENEMRLRFGRTVSSQTRPAQLACAIASTHSLRSIIAGITFSPFSLTVAQFDSQPPNIIPKIQVPLPVSEIWSLPKISDLPRLFRKGRVAIGLSGAPIALSIGRPNSSFCDLPRNVGFVRGVRLRHRSRPSVASRQTNLDARSGFRRDQGTHPRKAHIRSSITCRRRLPALSRTPPMKAMLASLRETRIV